MKIALIIAVIIVITLVAIILKRNAKYEKMKEEATAYQKAATTMEQMYLELKASMEKADSDETWVYAEYYTSDSESSKYSSQMAYDNVIVNRLALLIGTDISRKVFPSVAPTEDGGRKYYYSFKVRSL